ncbi:MAG: DUF3179 domain-containing (seleno)protein [Acidobacteria bacterium]|nr:DUF3179 domain-containing (seleno)protein [Acidobacteriota bacterium]
MSDNQSLLWKSFLVLAVFSGGLMVGVYWPSPTSRPDTQVSAQDQEVQFPPRGGSLALAPSRRFIFLPLNNPGVVPAAMASHMKAEDLIAGLAVNGQARAYPLWILVAYHVVNDTIQDSPVMLAFCEICSGASSFRPVVDGFEEKSLSFQIHGIARGTFTVYDYQTQTVWSPFTGRTLEGRLHPSRMDRIPLIVETWGDWIKRFPDTDVVFASTKFKEREHGRGENNLIGAEYIPEGFQAVANMDDTRLARNALVFGLTNLQGDKSIAFPLELLEKQNQMLRYNFDNESYLLRKIGEFGVVAFRLQEGQEEKSYQQTGENPFRLADDAGGLWDEFGNALNESRDKRDLAVADGYFTEWYEWVSGYPESEIASP